jgi:hypothetical protein
MKNLKNIDYKWFISIFALIIFYTGVFYLYHDKYLPISDFFKYDIAAEIYKRLLFTGGIEGIDQYSREFYGIEYSSYRLVTATEKPLYFLLLSMLKLFSPQPVGLLFFANMALLGISIFLISETLQPANKKVFIILGGIICSPFIVFQAINYQPHVLEVFLTCLAVFFFKKEKHFWAFFCITASIYAHPSNLPLLLSFWIYHTYMCKRNWDGYKWALLGSFAWVIAFSSIESILFTRDSFDLFPHIYQWENILLFKGQRTSGNYSSYPGFINFWKNSFILVPIATVGLFWIRNKFQFAITLLPIIIILIATKFNMAAQRNLLPIYFLTYAYFFCYFLSSNTSKIKKQVCIVIMALAMGSSLLYHNHVAQCLSIRDETKVSIERPPVGYSNGGSYDNLLWNMKRFNQINDNGKIVYSVFKHPISQPSNIPDPLNFYPYFLTKIIGKFIKPELIGIDTTTPREYSLKKVMKVPEVD